VGDRSLDPKAIGSLRFIEMAMILGLDVVRTSWLGGEAFQQSIQ
jgi:hypothetical protein